MHAISLVLSPAMDEEYLSPKSQKSKFCKIHQFRDRILINATRYIKWLICETNGQVCIEWIKIENHLIQPEDEVEESDQGRSS